jgi:hypothetical protein
MECTYKYSDLVILEFLNLQLDESAAVCAVSQLPVFIRIVFNDESVSLDALQAILSVVKYRGEDMFQSFVCYPCGNERLHS